MSACRIARRIALTRRLQNCPSQAARAQSLATKVLPLPLQPFTLGGGQSQRPLTTCNRTVAPCRWAQAGAQGEVAGRLVWGGEPLPTPFTSATLVTNGSCSEVGR
jgi:hypothetical protein